MNAAALPIITDPTPSADWTPPTTDINGDPIPAGEITGYEIGIRDLAVTGSVAGTYPATVQATGATAITEALTSFIASKAMVPGHSYAIAAMTLANTPPGNSQWGVEYQFTWQPLAAPMPPTALTVT
jgi:hypothetical protein